MAWYIMSTIRKLGASMGDSDRCILINTMLFFKTIMIRRPRACRVRRPSVEHLEQRRLLTTYFVDNNAGDHGSNSNSGTSLSAPFLTIQQAATVAEPGDTVDIVAGTYREEDRPIKANELPESSAHDSLGFTLLTLPIRPWNLKTQEARFREQSQKFANAFREQRWALDGAKREGFVTTSHRDSAGGCARFLALQGEVQARHHEESPTQIDCAACIR